MISFKSHKSHRLLFSFDIIFQFHKRHQCSWLFKWSAAERLHPTENHQEEMMTEFYFWVNCSFNVVWTGCCELQQSERRWDVHVRDLQPPCWAHQALNPASLKRAAFRSDRRVTERRWHDVCWTTLRIQLHKDNVCSQEVIVWITNKTSSQVSWWWLW